MHRIFGSVAVQHRGAPTRDIFTISGNTKFRKNPCFPRFCAVFARKIRLEINTLDALGNIYSVSVVAPESDFSGLEEDLQG
jgi:hypothetical protein